MNSGATGRLHVVKMPYHIYTAASDIDDLARRIPAYRSDTSAIRMDRYTSSDSMSVGMNIPASYDLGVLVTLCFQGRVVSAGFTQLLLLYCTVESGCLEGALGNN